MQVLGCRQILCRGVPLVIRMIERYQRWTVKPFDPSDNALDSLRRIPSVINRPDWIEGIDDINPVASLLAVDGYLFAIKNEKSPMLFDRAAILGKRLQRHARRICNSVLTSRFSDMSVWRRRRAFLKPIMLGKSDEVVSSILVASCNKIGIIISVAP